MGIIELIYYLGYKAKRCHSLKRQKKLSHKVISIGNITAGGTGKTPATIALAEEAKKRGFYPIVLTRGYKGKAKGPIFISYEPSAMNHELFGDEPVLMANKLRDVPVVKCADRYKGGMFALSHLPIHHSPDSPIVFILDDGFQHWKLFRDKDILLIDAEDPFDIGRLLPVGLLREPLKEMKRADIIVITKADSVEQSIITAIRNEIQRYNKTAPIFFASHKPAGFSRITGEKFPLEWAAGKNLFAFCGIGNPESFERTTLLTGGNLKGFRDYDDHHRYKPADINDIINDARKNNADWIITTEKDYVRLGGLNIPDNLIMFSIAFDVSKEFYDEAFK